MPEYDPFEEEEFSTQFNGRVIARMLAQVRPYWMWVVGFVALIALCSVGDSFFTYLSKRIIDEGILALVRWQPDHLARDTPTRGSHEVNNLALTGLHFQRLLIAKRVFAECVHLARTPP